MAFYGSVITILSRRDNNLPNMLIKVNYYPFGIDGAYAAVISPINSIWYKLNFGDDGMDI